MVATRQRERERLKRRGRIESMLWPKSGRLSQYRRELRAPSEDETRGRLKRLHDYTPRAICPFAATAAGSVCLFSLSLSFVLSLSIRPLLQTIISKKSMNHAISKRPCKSTRRANLDPQCQSQGCMELETFNNQDNNHGRSESCRDGQTRIRQQTT